ncbi:hypothetical protein DACRYDRAFT_23811 [Dacryopinax primogenitus]|uniref:Large ribosomal subunit protein mL54 n=1 Tax=Dacryopinax primogenitus (strain DJM 731) TaxID=1858805 RepID=M5FT71_DACPD|nr:uncharacterized protein DACRYDRAFT_23811 [Dacryopinax primogenitus]EJT99198.1 hypothetical protein DACRYDRAFT_23811 [Dacryopinax primogenitus]
MTSLWIGTSRSALFLRNGSLVCTRHARRGMAVKVPSKPPPTSSCPPGTVLTGIQYLKDAPPVIAMPDTDYPAWLWTLLDEPAKAGAKGKGKGRVAPHKTEDGAEELDEKERERRRILKDEEELTAQRKKMRKESRERIRQQNFMKTT